MAEEKIDVSGALKHTDANKNQKGFLKDMLEQRNKSEDGENTPNDTEA